MLDSWLTEAKDGRKQRACRPWKCLTLHLSSPVSMIHAWHSVQFLGFSHLYIQSHANFIPKKSHLSNIYICCRLEKLSFYLCVCGYVWVYVYMWITCIQALWGGHRGCRIPWNSIMGSEVPHTFWKLNQLNISERDVSILNHWVISLAPGMRTFKWWFCRLKDKSVMNAVSS